MATSQKQLTINGLLACGWTLDENARSSKYLVYVRPDVGRRMLVGKSGALRMTTTSRPAISDSLSLTGTSFHRALRTIGSRKDSYSSAEQARAELQAAMPNGVV